MKEGLRHSEEAGVPGKLSPSIRIGQLLESAASWDAEYQKIPFDGMASGKRVTARIKVKRALLPERVLGARREGDRGLGTKREGTTTWRTTSHSPATLTGAHRLVSMLVHVSYQWPKRST
ncbi:hypothetical protein AOLI_G00129430 [Acnodon oligacanthus]